MGYKQIADHLNQKGIRTIKGNQWGSNNVHSLLKRNRERVERLKIQEGVPKSSLVRWKSNG